MFALERCDNLVWRTSQLLPKHVVILKLQKILGNFCFPKQIFYRKQLLGAPAGSRLEDLVSQAIRFPHPILLILCLKILANKQLSLDRRLYCLPIRVHVSILTRNRKKKKDGQLFYIPSGSSRQKSWNDVFMPERLTS